MKANQSELVAENYRTFTILICNLKNFICTPGERNLTKLVESVENSKGQQWNVEDIKRIVTAQNLCSCKNPIDMAFKVYK